MPLYEVEDDKGNVLELEGDSPPTEQELEQIFSEFGQQRTVAQPLNSESVNPSFGDRMIGGLEAAASTATGIPATIAGGLAGIGGAVATQDSTEAVEIQNKVRDLLTFEPKTPEGQAALRQLNDALQSVGEFVQAPTIMKGLGEFGAEVGGIFGGDQARAVGSAVMQTSPAAATLGRLPGRGPRNTPETTPKPTPETATDSVIRSAQKLDQPKLIESADIDPNAVAAADRLGIDAPVDSLARNPSFIETAQALKSQPGSKLAAQEQTAIRQLNEQATQLLRDFGGTSDRSLLDTGLRQQFDESINRLQSQSNAVFEKTITPTIPKRELVAPVSAKNYIDDVLADLGDDKALLSSAEKQLLRLTEKDEITYAALDRLRKDVGDGFNRSGPFKYDSDYSLRQVYKALSDDQMRVADRFGVGDDLRSANELVSKRHQLQDSAVELFGRNLDGSLLTKISTAATRLTAGDLSNFKKLMAAVPENRKAEASLAVIDRIMTAGSRGGSTTGGGFATAFEGIKRNPGVKKELFQHLPAEARQRFNDLGAVASTLFRNIRRENTSRTARDILAAIDDVSALNKVYGVGKQVAAAEGATSAVGIPGAGTIGILASKLGPKTAKSEAADNLLSSPRFRVAIEKVAEGKTGQADKIIQGSSTYKKWAKVNPELADQISRIGFIAWLSSEQPERQ